MPRLTLLLGCLAALPAVACSKSPPTPPVVSPSTNETITGNERIGWDQRAADAGELGSIGYVLYVDGVRTPLTGATCAATPSASGFTCTAPLPPLGRGTHALQLASFVNDGDVLESERSATLQVTVASTAVTKETNAAPTFSGATFTTAGGVRLRADLVAAGFNRPTDLAFAPDGRLFVAERDGRVRIVERAPEPRLLPDPALTLADERQAAATLLAVAIDPDFETTQFVFLIYAAPSRAGDLQFSVARFREASNTLADRVVLLDRVRASASPAAALRFGADRKMYVAFDDGGDPSAIDDMASLNGKTLRLNRDGTTPSDQPRMSPVYAAGHKAPRGFEWDLKTGRPTAAGSESTTPYRGGLFASLNGAVIAAPNDGRLVARSHAGLREPLGPDRIGGVTAVAVSPEGAIYFATANAIGRLVPNTP